MHISGIENDSVVDGEGIRLTVFFQGCAHRCVGCHNPETWPFNAGTEYSIEDILNIYDSNPLLDGITLSGGDPIYQAEEGLELTHAIQKRKGTVWLYTGFTLEELRENKDPIVQKLINSVDVIVDGPFILEQRDLTLQFRGSSNQRILRKGTDY